MTTFIFEIIGHDSTFFARIDAYDLNKARSIAEHLYPASVIRHYNE